MSLKILHSHAGVAQQIWIASPDGAILVDCGDGTLRDILANNLPHESLAGIFITHGHFDHMAGLHALLGFFRMIGRTESLRVFVPENSLETLLALEAFAHSYPETMPYQIELREIPAGAEIEIAGMTVASRAVVHCGGTKEHGILDPIPAYGYRVTCDDECIAITGDTGDCPVVREMVDGVDLAVIEATYPRRDEYTEGVLELTHLSEDIAHDVGSAAKEYILVHKSP